MTLDDLVRFGEAIGVAGGVLYLVLDFAGRVIRGPEIEIAKGEVLEVGVVSHAPESSGENSRLALRCKMRIGVKNSGSRTAKRVHVSPIFGFKSGSATMRDEKLVVSLRPGEVADFVTLYEWQLPESAMTGNVPVEVWATAKRGQVAGMKFLVRQEGGTLHTETHRVFIVPTRFVLVMKGRMAWGKIRRGTRVPSDKDGGRRGWTSYSLYRALQNREMRAV